MSGLEKFQDSAQFRTHLKKFLLTERKPNPQPSVPSLNESQRYSLDIVEDLKNVLEERKNPQHKKEVMFQQLQQTTPQQKKKKDDDVITMEKENMAPLHASAAHHRQTFPASKVARNEVSTLSCNDTVFEDAAANDCNALPTDESFETLERMCDKTASDPDSTLFTYLHSDCQKRVLEEAKQRSIGETSSERIPRAYDAEADALQRLLDELRVSEERQLENESMLKGVDVTQLEDIEAPSRMWEMSTISGGSDKTLLQTSPVKMVGLLRPSTIIEDADESSTSNTSTQMSFQSAELKSGATTTAPSEVSSSCYETADESTTASSNTAATQQQQQQLLLNNIDDYLLKDFGDGDVGADDDFNAAQKTLISPPTSHLPSTNPVDFNANQSIDLIDLERTFAELQNSSQTSLLEETLSKFIGNKLATPSSHASTAQLKVEAAGNAVVADVVEDSDSEESIIEILSDDDDDEDINAEIEACASSSTSYSNKNRTNEDVEVHKIKFESRTTSSTSVIADDGDLRRTWSSTASINDDEADKQSNKGNCLENSSGNDDKSLHFNDTMEEVDYILAKGMQQMAEAAAATASATCTTAETKTVAPTPPPLSLKAKQSTFLLSPKVDDRYRSPSPMLHKQRPMTGKGTAAGTGNAIAMDRVAAASSARGSPRTGTATVFAKPAPVASSSASATKPKAAAADRFALVMKPVPKFELFVKPNTPRSGIPTSAAMRQKPFANIVSPIGAYMKKTGSSPLMTNFKSSNQHNRNADLHNATAFRTLEYESRLYQPIASKSDGAAAAKLKKSPARTLPKKAYISSQFKHIVDERTPVTIPGGKSIQKYLESAMLPAVVRHDGKVKMPGAGGGAAASTKHQNQSAQLQPTGEGDTATASKRTADASLADLSLMSGDVSMYTIMDARKF